MQYHHLTIEEREKIQLMWWERRSVRSMAHSLSRSPSSISRELKRNFPECRNTYTPRTAHEQALLNRKNRGRTDRLKNQTIRDYVIEHLKIGWSPEQIANTLPTEYPGYYISHEAIYQYIYSQVHREGYGYIKPGKEDLRPYLALRRKRRMKKGLRKPHRIEKGPLPSIDERPKEADLRIKIGHWEDDSIVSRASLDRLKTTNERVSGVVFINKARNGTIEASNKITNQRLSTIPQQYRKTLTRDRGSENLGYKALEQALGIRCFFAHAYCSCERGSNENVNGLIRRFFPKKTDFRTITDEEIQRVEYLLNTRPRKRLGWKTPYQVFYELTGVALQC